MHDGYILRITWSEIVIAAAAAPVVIGLFVAGVMTARCRFQRHCKLLEHANQDLARFRAAVEAAPVSVVITAPDGSIEYTNPHFSELTGYLPDEVLGQNPRILRSEFTRPEVYVDMWNSLNQGRTWRGEFCNRKKSGELFWEAAAISVMRDSDQRITNFVAVKEDITATKLHAEEMRQKNRQLQEAARHAGMAEVANGVLHNVGNVLNSINTSTSVLRRILNDSRLSGMEKLVKQLHANSHRLADYLAGNSRGEHLLDYVSQLSDTLFREHDMLKDEVATLGQFVEHVKAVVRMQQSYAGAAEIYETIDVPQLFSSALATAQHELKLLDVRVVQDLAEAPSFCSCHHKILQILINLISNAKQALAACDTTQRELTLRSRVREETVELIVADNGSGISAEDLPKIFQHGFTTRQDGHGFGLHNSALLASELGGSLSVTSSPERGATFTLRLPATVHQLTGTVIDAD